MLDEPIPIELPADLLDAVVDKLLHAGGIAQRSYNEQDKWDLTAFATVLWRLSWNHVADELSELGGKVWYEKNSLRFELGGFTCSVYAGGHSVDWDVQTYDFTRSRKRAETINPHEVQGQLFNPSELDRDVDVDPSELPSLIFVNCGDPDLGTAALYLGAPIGQGELVRWAWVRRLYVADSGGTDRAAKPDDYTPFGSKPEPDVVIRPRDDDGTAGTGSA